MAYVTPDYRTKKALKDALKAGESIGVYQPGIGNVPLNGSISLEGPHYPKPHTWYAEGIMENGVLIKVK
jgi:hypothetical protein